MKKPLLALVVFAAVASGVGALAQAPAETGQNHAPVAIDGAQSTALVAPRLRLRGMIENYEPSTRTLSLSTANGTMRLPLAATARIGRGAQKLDASELRKLAGYRAAIRYLESGGNKTVESVSVFEKSERIAR